MIGYMEIMEISVSVLGLLFLVGIFICIRKRYVQQKKKKPVCVQDSNGYVFVSKKEVQESWNLFHQSRLYVLRQKTTSVQSVKTTFQEILN